MDQRERDLADLTALADGSLPEERRPEVERRVAASHELSGLLARQRRALETVRGAAVPAPAGLRARVEAERAHRRRPVGAAAGLAAAAAGAGLLVLLLMSGGAPEAPSVARAAELAARGPSAGPPPRYDDAPLLDREVGGIRFPRWEERFGWRASGLRTDRLGERSVATVYYSRTGRRIGYTIVDGLALEPPVQGGRATRAGTQLRYFRDGGRTVVTWRRRGRTCILSGPGVSARTLIELAAWRAGGGIEY